jgi:hypothetical protein
MQTKIVFNCFGMISSVLGPEESLTYAVQLLSPLYKVSEGFAGKVVSGMFFSTCSLPSSCLPYVGTYLTPACYFGPQMKSSNWRRASGTNCVILLAWRNSSKSTTVSGRASRRSGRAESSQRRLLQPSTLHATPSESCASRPSTRSTRGGR